MNFKYDALFALDKVINFIFCGYHFWSTLFLKRAVQMNYPPNLFFCVFRFGCCLFFMSNPSLDCFYYLSAYLLLAVNFFSKTSVAFSKTTNACRISCPPLLRSFFPPAIYLRYIYVCFPFFLSFIDVVCVFHLSCVCVYI